MIQYKTFRSTGIDLQKLYKQKEWRLILRILRVFNDITLAPALGFLLSFSPKDAELEPIHNAVNWQLLRWRSATAAEAIKNVIEPLKEKESDLGHEVWQVIRKDAYLSERWNQLKNYFSDGKHQQEKIKALAVRDKLVAHYDLAPINKAFEKKLELGNKGIDKIIGWHLQSSDGQQQIARNVLLDELTNLAWYQIYGIEVTEDGPDENQINEEGQLLVQFLSLVANFVNGVVIRYCEHYNLTTIETVPPWISASSAQEQHSE